MDNNKFIVGWMFTSQQLTSVASDVMSGSALKYKTLGE
jgi:hypothetical protein